jgi:hypothetical protein
MRIRPLPGAVLAAGLLASGCDYWRNLVDDRTVATAHLKLKVIDMYTLDPLVATCTDTARGLELVTALGSGQAEKPNAGTGTYTIHCHASWGYYDRSIGVPLTPGAETVIFRLARLGDEGVWYKDDTLREVRIQERFDTLRFPGDFDFNAYPEDTTKLDLFRYVWTFAKAKGLDQINSSTLGKKRNFHNTVALANTVPGPDTLTLQVWSMMNDPKVPYPIGMVKRPFVWARNQLPKLSMTGIPEALFLVGCPESQPLRINFSAADPDGECESVRFHTVDKKSSFGAVDTTLTCNPDDLQFPLRNTFEPLRTDSAWMRDNELKVTVTDDNGGRFDTSIVIKTRTNILPTVTSSIENLKTSAFIDDSIKVYFEASDSDGTPQSAIINWAGVDGETRKDFRLRKGHTLRDSAIWSYQTPGWKFINVAINDECNASVNSLTDSILIRKNRDPVVELKYYRDEGTEQNHLYVFELTVKDQDIREGLDDRITEVYVNWGEGQPFEDFPNIGSTYIKTLKHHFTRPPDSLGRYQILIDAHDAHHGSGTLDTLFLTP